MKQNSVHVIFAGAASCGLILRHLVATLVFGVKSIKHDLRLISKINDVLIHAYDTGYVDDLSILLSRREAASLKSMLRECKPILSDLIIFEY